MARDQAEAELGQLVAECEPFGSAAARRLMAALAILEDDSIADNMPDGRDRREEARALYPCAAHLGSRYADLISRMLLHRSVLLMMVSAYQGAGDTQNKPLTSGLLRAGSTLHGFLVEFQSKVGDSVVYPFEHAEENITLARFALPTLPDTNDIGGLLQASHEALDRLGALYVRALGRIAVTAEEVECALGLPPIEFAPEAADPCRPDETGHG